MAALTVFFIFLATVVFSSMRARAEIDRAKEFDRIASSFLNMHFKAIGFKGKAMIVRGHASVHREDAP